MEVSQDLLVGGVIALVVIGMYIHSYWSRISENVLTDEIVLECLNYQPGSGIPTIFLKGQPYQHMNPNTTREILENMAHTAWKLRCNARFSSVRNFVFRQLKLLRKRRFNKYYCVKRKLDPNYVPKFVYNGNVIEEHYKQYEL